jgi:molybdenum cofactor synthesis domain-containing protein
MSGAADNRETVTAAVLIIGNEILSGRTQDVNLNYLAKRLTELGIKLSEARVVPDIPEEIIAAVNGLRARYDHVFTTGGIGPTHDDITSECVAQAFGLALIRHPEAVKRLEARYEPGTLNEARLRMANTPEGAELIDNPVSAAPGYRIGNVYVMAGVPSIMRAMFETIAGTLRHGAPIRSCTIGALVGEGIIAQGLGDIQAAHPDLDLGSYPFFRQGKYGASFVIKGTDPARIDAAAMALRALIRSLGAEPIEGELPE